MAIGATLETETGKIVHRLTYEPPYSLNDLLPPFTDTSFFCWRFIDRYGFTVFNRMQMDVFQDELARIRETTTTPQHHRILDELEHMARYCKRHPHHYLRFIGD